MYTALSPNGGKMYKHHAVEVHDLRTNASIISHFSWNISCVSRSAVAGRGRYVFVFLRPKVKNSSVFRKKCNRWREKASAKNRATHSLERYGDEHIGRVWKIWQGSRQNRKFPFRKDENNSDGVRCGFSDRSTLTRARTVFEGVDKFFSLYGELQTIFQRAREENNVARRKKSSVSSVNTPASLKLSSALNESKEKLVGKLFL